MSKYDRAKYGPGWGEVIFGAVLSLVLGVVVGALLLVFKPVTVVKETPKEMVPGQLYYVAGLSGDANKAKTAMAKRKALVSGQSVRVTEDEINSLVTAAAGPAKQDKPAAGADGDKPAETVSIGTPNVRIRGGSMQVAAPVVLNVWGLEQKVIAQARGGFVKNGDAFAYDPDEIYVGSCPIQRLPFVNTYIREKLASSQKIPEDIASAWPKLANVTIDGNTLVLAMQ